MGRPRLLLADRIKSRSDSFLAPLIPALERSYDTRFVSLPPSEALAQAIGWADIVWLEWCWDHAVWAAGAGLLRGKPCIVRLHSVEALQTDFPARLDWSQVRRLVLVGDDISALLIARCPALATVPCSIIPNGIDLDLFAPAPDGSAASRFRVAWVGHLEPKKNPMLMLQVAHRLTQVDPRYSLHVAGAATDLRTERYLRRLVPALGLADTLHFHGVVPDMPAWYRDKGVLLSTTMYESFGLNIGEAMAVGAFPVVHDFPGADLLWPAECLFASVDEAVALIQSAVLGRYRDWIRDRYPLGRQEASILTLLESLR